MTLRNEDGDALKDIIQVYNRLGPKSIQYGYQNKWHTPTSFLSFNLSVTRYRIAAKHANTFDPRTMDFKTWAQATIDQNYIACCRIKGFNYCKAFRTGYFYKIKQNALIGTYPYGCWELCDYKHTWPQVTWTRVLKEQNTMSKCPTCNQDVPVNEDGDTRTELVCRYEQDYRTVQFHDILYSSWRPYPDLRLDKNLDLYRLTEKHVSVYDPDYMNWENFCRAVIDRGKILRSDGHFVSYFTDYNTETLNGPSCTREWTAGSNAATGKPIKWTAISKAQYVKELTPPKPETRWCYNESDAQEILKQWRKERQLEDLKFPCALVAGINGQEAVIYCRANDDMTWLIIWGKPGGKTKPTRTAIDCLRTDSWTRVSAKEGILRAAEILQHRH